MMNVFFPICHDYLQYLFWIYCVSEVGADDILHSGETMSRILMHGVYIRLHTSGRTAELTDRLRVSRLIDGLVYRLLVGDLLGLWRGLIARKPFLFVVLFIVL